MRAAQAMSKAQKSAQVQKTNEFRDDDTWFDEFMEASMAIAPYVAIIVLLLIVVDTAHTVFSGQQLIMLRLIGG